MQQPSRKQFEFCALFPANGSDNWVMYRVRVGEGLGYSFRLVGTVRSGEAGMAVFGINNKFLDVVSKKAFTRAAEILEVGHFYTVFENIETFQEWVLERDVDYWMGCESSSDIIRDFLQKYRIVGSKNMPVSEVSI